MNQVRFNRSEDSHFPVRVRPNSAALHRYVRLFYIQGVPGPIPWVPLTSKKNPMGACTRYARHGLRIPCVRALREHRDTGPCDALRAAGRSHAHAHAPVRESAGAPERANPTASRRVGGGMSLRWDLRISGRARDRRRIFGAPPPRARGLRTAWRGLKPGALGSGSERWRPGALRARQDVKTRVCENPSNLILF